MIINNKVNSFAEKTYHDWNNSSRYNTNGWLAILQRIFEDGEAAIH